MQRCEDLVEVSVTDVYIARPNHARSLLLHARCWARRGVIGDNSPRVAHDMNGLLGQGVMESAVIDV